MPSAEIESIYRNFKGILAVLEESEEASLMISAQDNFRKALLLAAASYFESKIVNDLELLFAEKVDNNPICLEFIKNKAIKRQYHTFFNWDGNNGNQFFGLFGSDFRSFMKTEIERDKQLERSVQAFLQLGSDRNSLVHENYANYSLQKTVEEIFSLYNEALIFIEVFPEKLRSSIERPQ